MAQSEVLLRESEVTQRRADLPVLLKAAEEQRTLIAVLIGRTTELAPPSGPTLDVLRLPDTLPVRLPSALVRQRPDILSAEAALQAANARIGVATANMLPRLTLTAVYGMAQAASVDAFTPQGLVWSVAAGLTQPLFQGDRLARQRDAAIAARDVAAAQYRGTVLGAFKNVADALRAVELDAETLQAQREAARVEAAGGVARGRGGQCQFLRGLGAALGVQDLHQSADQVGVQAKVMLQHNLGRTFYLHVVAIQRGDQPSDADAVHLTGRLTIGRAGPAPRSAA
ncbi:TolC family protein [Teichococcus aestuarii]|uniref:TolC family protein n=1 Tax=Teichococcus aestuarii TaxID=568898 RepID=UPI000D69B95B|nr:TolC family protein [Pseudoroseomonas aestuarii]